jgi:hypothetical protein
MAEQRQQQQIMAKNYNRRICFERVEDIEIVKM